MKFKVFFLAMETIAVGLFVLGYKFLAALESLGPNKIAGYPTFGLVVV